MSFIKRARKTTRKSLGVLPINKEQKQELKNNIIEMAMQGGNNLYMFLNPNTANYLLRKGFTVKKVSSLRYSVSWE
jgi:hypothetical protein